MKCSNCSRLQRDLENTQEDLDLLTEECERLDNLFKTECWENVGLKEELYNIKKTLRRLLKRYDYERSD